MHRAANNKQSKKSRRGNGEKRRSNKTEFYSCRVNIHNNETGEDYTYNVGRLAETYFEDCGSHFKLNDMGKENVLQFLYRATGKVLKLEVSKYKFCLRDVSKV